MLYQGKEVHALVIYPSVAEAIAKRRIKKGLPEIPVNELEYGMDEVMQIVNLLDADLLAGRQATLHGLLDILAKGYDIVWLITHAEPEGWFLSDGIVSVSETTTLIRSSGTFLTIMNTCSSIQVAERAATELGTAFICTISEVPDRTAFITGVIFAQKLASGLDYVRAYQLAKPGQNDTYKLIEATEPMADERGRFRQQGNAKPDSETWVKFARSVEELDIIVNGAPRIGLIGLKDIIKTLQARLDTITVELSEIKDRQKVRNWLMWGMGVTIIALLLTVSILVSRL